MAKIADIKARLRRKKQKAEPKVIPNDQLLSTGSTLLNLAISGKPQGGFVMGKYHYLVGDSSSGKTWLSLTCMAEAARSKRFKDYRFIYDNGEDGALMDMEFYFGKKMADRLEPPGTDDDGNPVFSETIDDFFFHLDDARERGEPVIYVLDSMDSLSSDYEGKKFEERKKARRKGTQAKGDYGDGKAKANSAGIRRIIPFLRDSGSILIIISQTRDNINAGLFEDPRTRSGGRALKFYAACEIWSSVGKVLKREVNKKKRKIGIHCNLAIHKNRLTGRDRRVSIPLYHSVGIDDTGSCVDFLCEEGYWTKPGGRVKTGDDLDIDKTYYRDELINKIEDDPALLKQLRVATGKAWRDIESKLKVERKRRYE